MKKNQCKKSLQPIYGFENISEQGKTSNKKKLCVADDRRMFVECMYYILCRLFNWEKWGESEKNRRKPYRENS